MPVDLSSSVLARRLKALRTEGWNGATITQGQLAKAFAVSTGLLSSWESGKAVPPPARLDAYATFFATERSVQGESYRLLAEADLTAGEIESRDRLLEELERLAESGSSDHGFWYFRDAFDITIVVAKLPDDQIPPTPFTDPASPDYVELYTYADLDSLIELHGHIRSVNPRSVVHFRTADSLTPDDYTTHLVLLGGVDWNIVTKDVVDRVDLPVNQAERETVSDVGGFAVREGDEDRVFAPILVNGELVEDVAQFYRGLNPYNKKRTVTICNGMFGRGTLGAVRALTDAKFRDRNEDYLRGRFDGQVSYSMITRVTIANRQVVTPDWTESDNRLFEWPQG